MSPENKDHYESEKEAIHLILTGIGDEIYSTVDACKTAHEIHKGKEIAKPITPLSYQLPDEDRYKNDNQNRNQRAVNAAGARDTVGGQVMQQSGIQCFNFKEFVEKGVQLQAEESDWLADTDEEINEQELEAHYSYMAKI
ncbi:hypothetical protein Tco_1448182 [Tanacetum coccineum]